MSDQAPSQNGVPPDGRDPTTGRFLEGHKFGKGNPNLRRLAEAQEAVRQFGTPDAVRRWLERLEQLGMAGDVAALRILTERVLGRPEPVPMVDVPDLELGELRTAEQVADAIARVVRAAVAGEVPLDVAERIGALVARTGEAGIWRDLEARVAEIEKERVR